MGPNGHPARHAVSVSCLWVKVHQSLTKRRGPFAVEILFPIYIYRVSFRRYSHLTRDDVVKSPKNRQFLTTRQVVWYIISDVSVCLSVCQTITFESIDVGSSFSLISTSPGNTGQVHNVKVTGAKSVEDPYSRNVKLRSAITPFL